MFMATHNKYLIHETPCGMDEVACNLGMQISTESFGHFDKTAPKLEWVNLIELNRDLHFNEGNSCFFFYFQTFYKWACKTVVLNTVNKVSHILI